MPVGPTIPLTSIPWDDILFVALAALLLVSAVLVVTLRDIIRSGLALMLSFGALAGIYALLGNPLLAATQVLVYIGAIAVLILFAIMLTQIKNAPLRLAFNSQAAAGALAAIGVAVVIVAAVLTTTWPAGSQRLLVATSDISKVLFNQYVLPFEVVSVLLTAAVLGGVLLARPDPVDPEKPKEIK